MAAPWTIIREPIAAGTAPRVSFPDAIALQVRGPLFIPGLELRFIEDTIGDALHSWPLEAPGALVPWGGSGKAEIAFPDTIALPPDVGPLEIVAYHKSSLGVLPALASAAAARNYDEAELLAFERNKSCPVASRTTLFEPSDTERVAGDIEHRRFSTVVAYVSVDTDPGQPVVEGEWNLQLMVEVDGAFVTFVSEPGTRSQVWMDLQTGANARRVCLQAWPIPFAPFRIGLWNEDAAIAGTAHFHIFRTTQAFASYTV